MESETIKPDLGVLERSGYISPVESLVTGSITVVFESLMNDRALVIREELCRVGIVEDEEISGDRNHDSEESFLQSD